jgi:DNA-binding GntR family transcriptional regulator
MPKSVTETKYYQLSQKLCRLFKSMSPGDVVPTVTELKGRYNVSQATVDSALSRLRDEGLIYRPAGQMRPSHCPGGQAERLGLRAVVLSQA